MLLYPHLMAKLVYGRHWPNFNEVYEGKQNYTCSKCLAHFCFGEDCTGEDGNKFLKWCFRCENHYCKECVPSDTCRRCGKCFCDKCNALKACDDYCEANVCRDCVEKLICSHCNQARCWLCIRTYSCGRDDCNKVICGDCVESKGEGGECNECLAKFCSTECRYLQCSKYGWDGVCPTCTKESAISFRRKYQESQKEIEELSQGMEDLYKKYMNVDKEED